MAVVVPKEMKEEEHIWEPMSVEDAANLMSGVGVKWWIAGGWAIDLFLGRQTRTHHDIDILIRRDDQFAGQDHLADKGLLLYKTQQPGLKPWLRGEFIDRPVDDVSCRWSPGTPWVLQLMLLCTDGDQWAFKRDPTFRGRIGSLGQSTSFGIPYMRPHIQLFYKAKRETLDKDQSDFNLAVPQMLREDQAWLLQRLKERFSDGHRWIDQLKNTMAQQSPAGDILKAASEE